VKPKHPLVLPPMSAFNLSYLSVETNRWRIYASRTRSDDAGLPQLAWVGTTSALDPSASDPIPHKRGAIVTMPTSAYAWVATCSCKTHGECPASRALDKACDLWDGASLVRLPPYERKSK
jgi:hypothetical protein